MTKHGIGMVAGCLILMIGCTPRAEPPPEAAPIKNAEALKKNTPAPGVAENRLTGIHQVTLHVPEMTERLALT